MDARARNEERRKAIEAKRKRLDEIRRTKADVKKDSSVKAVDDDKGAGLNNLIEELLNKPGEEKVEEKVVEQVVQKKSVVLKSVSDICTVNVPFRPLETYCKGVQTDAVALTLDAGSPEVGSIESPRRWNRKSVAEKENQLSRKNSLEKVAGDMLVLPNKVDSFEEELGDDERACIENDSLFASFMSQSVRVVERAIKQNEMFDMSIDYGGLETINNSSNEKLSLSSTIFDERWSKDRTVTEMDQSPHHKELFLVSYGKRLAANPDLDWTRGSVDPKGVVLVWSTHMASERPEYVFTCQSPVHTARFHTFASNIIVGGTYSGEIVLWDLRAKSMPVQRSLLSVESHTHPVYCMEIAGSVNAHNLISTSTDGKMCVWSLANISQPTESRQLKWNKKDITVTAMGFPEGETNEFCVGSEDGNIFKAQVHGSKAGIQSQACGHFGPVTSLQYNKGSSSLSDLMLSTCMDWTINLWSQHRVSDKPLVAFSSSDYVYDAKWSPTNPALFATANGSGKLELWNINTDLELAQQSINTEDGTALSKILWHPSGKQIYVGDSRGKVRIYDVAPELANPRRDEWTRLENTIQNLIPNTN
mmetsp:Transcript_11835/g.19277  ORF Transcript_11835/g.19277 Transcript_11835/m.19277 type:complete len:590 (+) Transcript_11835:98-1867(+)